MYHKALSIACVVIMSLIVLTSLIWTRKGATEEFRIRHVLALVSGTTITQDDIDQRDHLVEYVTGVRTTQNPYALVAAAQQLQTSFPWLRDPHFLNAKFSDMSLNEWEAWAAARFNKNNRAVRVSKNHATPEQLRQLWHEFADPANPSV